MVKRFYTDSLLAVYSRQKSKRSFIYSIVALLIVVVMVLLFFMNGAEKSESVSEAPPSNQVMEVDLMRNLHWLNHHTLPPPKPEIGVRAKPLLVHKPSLPVINATRLSASSVVYAHPIVDKKNRVDSVQVSSGARRLSAGEVLHAVLESAIQSDFAGPVRAILSEPAYSYNGMHLVLPAGTRIIGAYQNSIKAAQVRVGIDWQRMILPNGSSVEFSAPATDPMGRIGVAASRVNTHFWKRFGEASLYSLLSAGAQLSGGLSADTLTAGQLLRSQVSSSFADTAMTDLEKNKNIAPTIYLDPGSEISIFVRRDMEF